MRKKKDVKAISQMLKGSNPRDYLLWVLGINNGLRTMDLVRLKVEDIQYLKAGESTRIVETKTGKDNTLVINKTVKDALDFYLRETRPRPDDYLFPSRKQGGFITSKSVGRLVRSWADTINVRGHFGAHTLRKTWGYHQRVYFGTPVEVLTKRFKHSSPSTTMVYLGIESQEVHDVLMHEIGG